MLALFLVLLVQGRTVSPHKVILFFSFLCFFLIPSLIVSHNVFALDICDVFPEDCQDLQDEVDELSAQLQAEVESLEQTLDAEYQDTLEDLAAIDSISIISGQDGSKTVVVGLEDQYQTLEIAEEDLAALEQQYEESSAQVRDYLRGRLALLEAEYERRRDELLEQLQNQFAAFIEKNTTDFSSFLQLQRLNGFNQNASAGYSEQAALLASGFNGRFGAYANKDGLALPINYQPFRFLSFDNVLAQSSEMGDAKLLSQARVFYGYDPYIYVELRGGAYIDEKSYGFHGGRLSFGGDIRTWGFDYETGDLSEEFSYQKLQFLYINRFSETASFVSQFQRAEYENAEVESILNSTDFLFGWRIKTTLFTLLTAPIDFDLIIHTPTLSELEFKDRSFDLPTTDWKFVFGLSQKF